MNWSVVAQNWPTLAAGTLNTVVVAGATIVLSVLLAVPLAIMRGAANRVLRSVATAFSWITRATPALALLFFAYYGLPAIGVYLEPLPAAILGLTLSAAGYNMEYIRAGLDAIPRGQYDAARALGFPFHTALRRLLFPQAMRVIAPPLVSNLTLVLKGSALASLVAVSELTGEGMALISFTYRPIEILLVVAAVYLALNSLLVLAQWAVERRYRFG
jgi:His/Glu/Gln/Arg/opine family amino acid ABC transporter permease subunit